MSAPKSRTLGGVVVTPKTKAQRGRVDTGKALGARVAQMRKQLHLSQEDLAKAAGVHRSYLSEIERGARNISLDVLERLAAALGVELPALLDTMAAYSDAGLRKVLTQKLDGMSRTELERALRWLDAARFA